MKTDEIREKYLSFFEEKGCVRRPSDVLVPKWDPTVLFTPAGMNQFKEQFLGVGKLEFTRATTCQKCLRTGDIGNVGVTAYHHTFFEMLGNFSFGDYFKREAIHWAWEFLTDKKWMGLDPERLTVSVYKGEHGFDEEAFKIWRDEIKLPVSRIAQLEEDENFWPASAPSQGPDGVCGPCSEIFFHPDQGKEVEIWNLVFTQYNRVGDPPNNLRPLPKKNIDTGMGLERMAAVMQGVQSNFEIDILKPLCVAAGEAVGQKYEFSAPQGRALRRIADHIRAVTFAVHEGVAPGTKGEEYVIRLLLRRAFLEGYLLGQQEPFLYTLVPAVIEVMSRPYPELRETRDSVMNTVRQEEQHFLGTIERGLSKFERLVESAKISRSKVLSGKDVFDLHQTDGFVLDLTRALAEDRGLSIDMAGFEKARKQHEEVSGKGGWGVMAAGPLDAIQQQFGETEYLGYETTEADATVVGLVVGGATVEAISEAGAQVDLVLNRTPFYGEAGGQVGDIGTLTGAGGLFEVLDTQKHGGLIVHRGRLVQGQIAIRDTVRAKVDCERRAGIRRAHSATHLLHHALRTTLGENTTQRGSVVTDDQLRFDFAHGRAVSEDELRRIEDEVNARIAEGAAVSTVLMDIDAARQAGAMALFGEKYPDRVRVVTMGEFSRELCGGTHLSNTGQVGVFKIAREEASSAGVRRITAVTGQKALERIRHAEELLNQLVQILKVPQPEDLPRRVEQLQSELRDAKRELQKAASRNVAEVVDELLAGAETVGGAKIVTHIAEGATRDSLRDMADQLRQKGGPVALLLGAEIDGKVALLAAVSKELIGRGVKAGDAVKVAAQAVGGGGGGRPDMAEAGGKDPAALPDAMQAAQTFYRQRLSGNVA
jgi:alanyl-tRNA synthetase